MYDHFLWLSDNFDSLQKNFLLHLKEYIGLIFLAIMDKIDFTTDLYFAFTFQDWGNGLVYL